MRERKIEYLAARAAAALKRFRESEGRSAFGEFLAKLLPWDWFITITFRDTRPNSPAPVKQFEQFRRRAIERLRRFLDVLQDEAGRPIGWIFVEGFGELQGRFHLHGVIAGTAHLKAAEFKHAAFKRFGLTTVESYHPEEGGDEYMGKHLVEGGDIHFGGRLLTGEFRGFAKQFAQTVPEPGRVVVARSADVPSHMFKQTFRGRRKR